MKKMIIALSMILALGTANANANIDDCRDSIARRSINFDDIKAGTIGGSALGAGVVAPLVAITSPVGAIVVAGVSGAALAGAFIHSKNLKNTIRLIDESYEYESSHVAGKMLMKALRKVNKRTDEPVGLSELAHAIIRVNEVECSCDFNSIRELSNQIADQLDHQ